MAIIPFASGTFVHTDVANANRAYPAQGTLSTAQDYTDYPGLSLRDLEIFLEDVRYQPNWRLHAEREADYYDGNQMEADVLAEMEERGMAPLITNLIRPTIDVVLGMEAKTRQDWKVIPDKDGDKETEEVAVALNVKLHEAERISRADRANSDAYAEQIKVGLSWVEVGRESDPFKARYRVKKVHRREIWWDWRSVEPDLADARYLFRRKWYDKDQLVAMFPKQMELIRHAAGGWPSFEPSRVTETGLYRDWEIERDSSIEDLEWRDAERERLALYEVWYRVWIRGPVLRLPTGRVTEYDPKDQRHVQAVGLGMIEPEIAVFNKMRLSWWIGPHRVHDMATPYKHNGFPYIPFFGYREDRTGVPYGLIRSMKSPQDEVNARRQKMMWLLSAKRVITDDDAVSGKRHDDVREEIARPDAYIILNENRKNISPDAFRVESDFELSRQQFMVMEESKQSIQDTGGVYQSMLGSSGRTKGGQASVGRGMSGVAIDQLIEQGTTTLAEINDNYNFAKRMVGDQLLGLVKEDLENKQETVHVKSPQGKKKQIELNKPGQDMLGNQIRTNDVIRTMTQVALEDVPSTPTYRRQQLAQLTEMTKGLAPELQTAIMDMIIEATDLTQRHEIAARIRKITGQDVSLDDLDEDERAKVIEEQRKKQAEQEEQTRLMFEMMQKELDEISRKVENIHADTKKKAAETEKLEAETDQIESETEGGEREQDLAERTEDFEENQAIDEQFAAIAKGKGKTVSETPRTKQ